MNILPLLVNISGIGLIIAFDLLCLIVYLKDRHSVDHPRGIHLFMYGFVLTAFGGGQILAHPLTPTAPSLFANIVDGLLLIFIGPFFLLTLFSVIWLAFPLIIASTQHNK